MLPLKNYRVFKNSFILSDLLLFSVIFFFLNIIKTYLALASYLNLTLLLICFLSLYLKQIACSY